ncbi:hypothetical protein YC2023_040517 [Brassica napus]
MKRELFTKAFAMQLYGWYGSYTEATSTISPRRIHHIIKVYIFLLLFVLSVIHVFDTLKWCRKISRNSTTTIGLLKAALNAVHYGHDGLQVTFFNYLA